MDGLLSDREGVLWVAVEQNLIRRLPEGRIERYTRREGLPSKPGLGRPPYLRINQVLPVEMVIPATGQQPRSELLESLPGVRLDGGRIVVDERTMQTSNPRYFAGGDCVSGGQEVVNAVADRMAGAKLGETRSVW